MPAGQPPVTSHIYAVRILTCDPTQRLIEAQLLADARRVQITTMPVAARWPMVGETWTIEFRNNTPYLCEPYPVAGSIESIPAGDAFINAPTGRLHVIGSVNGASDFLFSKTALLWSANNLSDLANFVTARNNLGFYGPVDTGVCSGLAYNAETSLTAVLPGSPNLTGKTLYALGGLYDGSFSAAIGWRSDTFSLNPATIRITFHCLRSTSGGADTAGWRGLILAV